MATTSLSNNTYISSHPNYSNNFGVAELGDDFTKFTTIYQWFQTLIHPALIQRQNFNSPSLVSWKVINGKWSVSDGNLVVNSGSAPGAKAIFSSFQGQNFELNVGMKSRYGAKGNKFGILFGYDAANNHHVLQLDPEGSISLFKVGEKGKSVLAKGTYQGAAENKWLQLMLRLEDNRLSVKINGKSVFNNIKSTVSSQGAVGLFADWNVVLIDNFQLATKDTQKVAYQRKPQKRSQEQIKPKNRNIRKFIKSSAWSPVFLRPSSEISSFVGGEGGQWLQALAIDSTDGNLLIAGTDVGGLYRSTNGGQYWESANYGYHARGSSGIYIDPNNPNRVLSVGSNSAEGAFNIKWHGLYLSEDTAASWKLVLPVAHSGYRDIRTQIAFDRSSKSNNRSNIVYYSSQTEGLFQSKDGGKNFKKISSKYGGAYLAVQPKTGALFVASTDGLFRSKNQGKTFTKILDGNFRGISVAVSKPNILFVNTADKIYISENGGDNFQEMNTTGEFGKRGFYDITVHPSNPKYLFLMNQVGRWEWYPYTSIDGGKTWRKGRHRIDRNQVFLPRNGRRGLLAWHPKDPNKMWSFGGDWISSSFDGGINWRWDANGYNGIMVGGLINFNTHYPNSIFLSSQDYNGSFSDNYGKNWKYINVSGKSWGGHSYGGTNIGPRAFVTSYTDSWRGQRYLATSLNGDLQVKRTKIPLNGANVSMVDPKNKNNIFVFDHRSTDGGFTWTKMQGCDGVFSYSNGSQKFLIGRNKKKLVISNNGGSTWKVITKLNADIRDAAYDYRQKKYYIAANERLYQWQNNVLSEVNTPKDQFGIRRVTTVAVDPVKPRIVYAGSSKNIYKTDVSVIRSMDGGNKWQVLTSVIEKGKRVDGALEATALRVHPTRRELWVATNCYGVWKYTAP
ncbi:hypothetical protein RintRC_5345 [Richelia intracellularis]|nr:hypothetical protein RintRC_5345 [Richelia intracellularis]